MTDGQLLEQYVTSQDEAAFVGLVHRHAPMVFGVCRRMGASEQDAEDAFQAAFLVLAQKAATVTPRDNVAGWLYGVANRTARNVRKTAQRRSQREQHMPDLPEIQASRAPEQLELAEIIDQELARLPEKYRMALVLVDLEGRTEKEAAAQVGCPQGTLSARLSRGRKMLAARLTKKGLGVTAVLLPVLLSAQPASAVISYPLLASTVEGVFGFKSGTAASGLTTEAIALAQTVMQIMVKESVKSICLFALTLTVVITAGSVIGHQLLARGIDSSTNAEKHATAASAEITEIPPKQRNATKTPPEAAASTDATTT